MQSRLRVIATSTTIFPLRIPTEEMVRRIDRLAYLKTAIVTISGGEPLLHPEIETMIQRIRHHGMIAGIITNGYLLTPKKIGALNEAGLEHLQISIDNFSRTRFRRKA